MSAVVDRIASMNYLLCWQSAAAQPSSPLRHERRDLDLHFRPLIAQPADIEQRGRREVAAQRFLPGGADPRARGLVFAAAGQVPGQADDVLRTCTRLAQQLDDALQR